ncbi:MAG: hypothetical protein NZT61_01925 [Deltaproteobacteria bacterium]|nr:hypothetical protein [Deltaproteobacteria bacterium]
MHVDKWIWGKEIVLTDLRTPFTVKILMPKKGVKGALSLQSHSSKIEYWAVLSGHGIAQFIVNDQLFSVFIKTGMVFKISPKVIHRLASIDNLKVFEASTLDKHSIDKSSPKDVVRFQCFHGRDCVVPESEKLKSLIDKSVEELCEMIHRREITQKKSLLARLKKLQIYLGDWHN